ncbi:MAG TPA: glycosyl hydrolase family 18 protein, partial [Herpetosiphonaceae bacterium]|nr:glycosyl hydrolase family 18 protein [Herpetosiphonaceae bacterium]
RLGALSDLVVVMAYDHGYAGGRPSPVAPLPWVRQVVDYTLSQVPRDKVLLDIPWYGYDWNITTRRPGRYIGFDEVVAKSGTHGYDQQTQAPSLVYTAAGQRHQVWYENARSVGQKLSVVVDGGLGGWAAWRLGYEDPEIWGLIAPRR